MTPAQTPERQRYAELAARELRDRFDARWVPEPNTGCWLWMGYTSPKGYGVFCWKHRELRAHRLGWSIYRGPIPAGMVLDHTCRVHCCVNPDHLRVVTHRQNTIENSVGRAARNAQKTHCPKGHLYETANTRIYFSHGRPQRVCRTCDRIRYHKRRAAAGSFYA